MTVKPLTAAIRTLHAEHMKNEDFDGFVHDLSVLIHEGLGDEHHHSLNLEGMTQHIYEYIEELKALA